MRFRQGLVLGVVSLLSAALVACNRTDSARPSSTSTKVSTAGIVLPRQLLGLQVKPEDVSKQFDKTKRAYVASVGLFSLRENDLVRATLEVGRFNTLARPNDPGFRAQIINRLGTIRPETLLVGDTIVYATAGTDQSIYAWFEGRGFFVLTTHREYEFPRTLLRRIIEAKQKL